MTRPLIAHAVVVTLGAIAFYGVNRARQGGDPIGELRSAGTDIFGWGLVLLAVVCVFMTPAMVLTVELVRRIGRRSAVARVLLGAASWAGWCLFIAVTLAVASRIFLVPDVVATDLILFAVTGGAFSLLAFDGSEVQTGWALVLLAVTVTAAVVLGSAWMAGRWGGSV